MNGLETISELTQNIKTGNPATWISLYYSFDRNAVNADGDGVFITNLINPNTPQDIADIVAKWMD